MQSIGSEESGRIRVEEVLALRDRGRRECVNADMTSGYARLT